MYILTSVRFLASKSFFGRHLFNVFADPAGRLCVLGVIISGKAFRLIGVYAPNDSEKREAYFRLIDLFVIS